MSKIKLQNLGMQIQDMIARIEQVTLGDREGGII